MLAKAKYYRGIEFICVNELPENQQLLLQHANEPERIKILVEGKIVSNCIQYKDYSDWFTTVFKRSIPPAIASEPQIFSTNIAVNKI